MNIILDSLLLIKWGLFSGIFLAISISFTSPFLILKRDALFPHALTHIYFLAIILASLISKFLPPFLDFPVVVIFTLIITSLIWVLRKYSKFYEDTTTSIISCFAMGLALIIASKTSQYDSRLFSYLFGSLVGITKKDFYESLIVFVFSIFLFYKFYPLWILQTTDKEIPGIDFKTSNLIFLILITLQIVIGVKLMGILLISALFIFSSSLALCIGRTLKSLIPIISLLNILGILGGTIFSIIWDIPFSSAVVIFMSLYPSLQLIWRILS